MKKNILSIYLFTIFFPFLMTIPLALGFTLCPMVL